MACRKKFSSGAFSRTIAKSSLADQCYPDTSHPFVRKMGYLRKLKTMKKKFFVLHEDSSNGPARLEYYDNEKKWRSGGPSKQVYELRKCFNINRKVDLKQKHVLALYMKDKCFEMAMDDEDQLNEWLMAMLEMQNGEKPPKPNFEHVWEVDVKCRDLGSKTNLAGRHYLCLARNVMLTLIRKNSQPDEQSMVKLPLWCIRRCGQVNKFLFIELGRSAVTGAGELWMQMEDTSIAKKVQEAIQGPVVIQQGSSEPAIQKKHDWPVTTGLSAEYRMTPNSALSNLAKLQDPEEEFAEMRTPVKYLHKCPSPYLYHQTARLNRSLDLGSNVVDDSNYLDMASPSQHDDVSNECVPMSPFGTSTTSRSVFCQGTTVSEQAYVNVADNTLDEYMPMAPVIHESKNSPSDDVYLSTARLSSILPQADDSCIASTQRGAHCVQDVTSGSYPRADPFRLDGDKMKAYTAPLELQARGCMKPVRDYSIERHQQLLKPLLTAQHLDATYLSACPVDNQAKSTSPEAELCTLRDTDIKASRKNFSAPLLGAMRPLFIPAISKDAKGAGSVKDDIWERIWNFYFDSQQRFNKNSSMAEPLRMSFRDELLEDADAQSNNDNQQSPKASLPHDMLQSKSPLLGPARPEEGVMSFGMVERRPCFSNSLPDSPCTTKIAESLYRAPLSVDSPAFDTQLLGAAPAAPMTQPSPLEAREGTTSTHSDPTGDYVDLDIGAKIVGPLLETSTTTPKVPVIKTDNQNRTSPAGDRASCSSCCPQSHELSFEEDVV